MSWTPPNVTTQTLAPGQHAVFLTDLKEITDPQKLQKFAAQAVFVASYKSVESAIEIDQIIKFNGSKADYYAGLNIDRLHLAAGLEAPAAGEALDLQNLKELLDGIEIQLVVNDRGYANEIVLPMPEAGSF
ncbi:hypothetical protein [Geothrix campi]|uniref:hypothetical protein n=1 Tax=Geothrix campi TaxID=2966450 RepID=UPI00214985AA|nr:hypothetical protein [Geothrix sp. SG10]